MEAKGTGPGSFFVGTARLELYLPSVASLKGKRAVLNRVKAALVRELGCSVAEVGYQELWQRSALGVAAAASTVTGAQRVLDRVVAIVERDTDVEVTLLVPDVADGL